MLLTVTHNITFITGLLEMVAFTLYWQEAVVAGQNKCEKLFPFALFFSRFLLFTQWEQRARVSFEM